MGRIMRQSLSWSRISRRVMISASPDIIQHDMHSPLGGAGSPNSMDVFIICGVIHRLQVGFFQAAWDFGNPDHRQVFIYQVLDNERVHLPWVDGLIADPICTLAGELGWIRQDNFHSLQVGSQADLKLRSA